MRTRKLSKSHAATAVALHVLALELKQSLSVPGNMLLGKIVNHYHQREAHAVHGIFKEHTRT
jgi:hypothetical protein